MNKITAAVGGVLGTLPLALCEIIHPSANPLLVVPALIIPVTLGIRWGEEFGRHYFSRRVAERDSHDR